MQQGEETVELQVSVESLKYGLMLQPLEERTQLYCVPTFLWGAKLVGQEELCKAP